MTEGAGMADAGGQSTPDRSPVICVVAGEASGDWAGAQLVRALREKRAGIVVRGIGGKRMAAAGVELLADSTDWGVIGVFDALRRVPRIYLALRRLRALLAHSPPMGVVLIDSGGVNIPLARMIRKLGLKTLYYLPPGSWSRRPRGRAVRDLCDVIATPFPWSKDLLAGGRARVEWVGHPVREAARPGIPKEAAWGRYGLDAGRPVMALAPGSRGQEMRYVLPIMAEAASLVSQRWEGVQFLAPVSDPVYEKPVRDAFRKAGVQVVLLRGMEYDALQLAEAAAVCSGTATLEFTCLGVPMVVVYKGSPGMTLEFLLLRGVLGNQWHAGMPNIIASREVVPELLWRYAKPEALARELSSLLEDEERRDRMKADLEDVLRTLGEPGASGKTAELVLDMISEREAAKPKHGH
jgi:lipid-A-disaccharide synthase